MKHILLTFIAILSLSLVGCGSGSGTSTTVANQLSPVFTQEEQDFVTEKLKTISSGTTILEKTINDQVISFSAEFDTTDDNDIVIKDGNGNIVKTKVKIEIKKSNNIYSIEEHYTCSYLVLDETYTSYDLSIQRLFGVYSQNDYFTQSQYDAFSNFVYDNPSQVDGINIIPGYNYTDDGVFSLNLYIDKGTANIYKASILKSNEKYIAVDKSGIIATEDTLVAIFDNKKITDKINDVILANADITANVSKNISTTSKKSTYNFQNIFKK